MAGTTILPRGTLVLFAVAIVLAAFPRQSVIGAEREPYIVVLRQNVSDPAAFMAEIEQKLGGILFAR